MNVGFVRCSTIEQNEARQMKMTEENNINKVFIEKTSGKDTNHDNYKATMAFVRAGEITATAAMQELNLKPNTFYRRVRDLNI